MKPHELLTKARMIEQHSRAVAAIIPRFGLPQRHLEAIDLLANELADAALDEIRGNAERSKVVADAHGSAWAPCPNCGSTMRVVRPGFAVCPSCDDGDDEELAVVS